MKNIFRKLHIGSGHEPNRSAETPSAPSPSSIISTTSTVPSPCSSDDRIVGLMTSVPPEISLPSPVEGAPALVADRVDYFSSEEEFQIQLALAISASNSEFREDLDGDQIRTATLLSLGTHRGDQLRQEEGVAESLSRRYWDYDVLDYNEKVVDGFYDIFGLPTNLYHGKMPSLHDLQTSIGDLGFEVIVVNRAVDTALVELEQVAHCITLDVSATEVMFLVQRLSELVSQNMGGPVKDANDILAHWVDKSTKLRTSLQTSLLPIGCINVGLSRHRALLFKVLADNIGIPCKLVKGSHYTGVDEDAINIIKHGDNREFLVDLMSAPGTLIPADVLSTMDTSLTPSNPRLAQSPLCKETDNSGDFFPGGKNGFYKLNGDTMFDRSTKVEMVVKQPFVVGDPSTSTASSSSRNTDGFYSQGLLNQFPFSSRENTKFESNKVPEIAVNEKKPKTLHAGDVLDPNNYFADLNPFEALKAGKINEHQRFGDALSSGTGRPLHPSPLIRKNRPLMNDVSNIKHYNFSEGVVRKNLEDRESNISRNTPIATGNSFANPFASSGVSCSDDLSLATPDSSGNINNASNQNDRLGNDGVDTSAAKEKFHVQFKKDSVALHNNAFPGKKEHNKNINAKRDNRRLVDDKIMARNVTSENRSPLVSSPTSISSIDPMLDDVAEWEIPWEDLVIGERIGLGSYGEVYHADWNGTEVAVKKFLDQDFYGDALDEFRSEVRIMRRLHHPNVVHFMGAVTRPPNLSIVSEFLPRGSLYRILHRPNCQIDEKRRIKMALDVAKGMNCLHTSAPTIVHRDLKSPNLLVDKNWTVKVCDFGLSRLKHSTFLSSKSTAGTPEWMAPEVLRNEPSNEKCDVYSFGVILWELATLKMPWSGMNPMQVVGAVGFQDRRLEIPKEVDPVVERIIWSCWQTEPSLRPSFAELKSALKSLQRLVSPSHLDVQSALVSQEIQVNSSP